MATYLRKIKPGTEPETPAKTRNQLSTGVCCCPQVVVYLVQTDCLNVSNSACPEW